VVAVFGALAVVAVIAVIAFSSDNGLPSGSKFFSASEDIERFTEEEREFMKFITEHRRFYFSKEEYAHRFQIFKQHLRYNKISNANPENTFVLGVNQFSDMTQEEFRYNYLNSEVPKVEGETVDLSGVQAPASVNWVQAGKVTAVENQGQCGSCWSFSATGAIEGAYAIKYNSLKVFSEQQLVDCCGSAYGSYGCNGGQMTGAFSYVKNNGQVLASQYPYTAKQGTCQNKGTPTVYLTGYVNVAQQNSDALLNAVAITPVSVAIEADQPVFQNYKSGVLNSAACGTNLDHGVLAVGYGSDGSTPYWLVKNSWGSSWGESGYIRIFRNSGAGKGICGIAMTPAYPIAK